MKPKLHFQFLAETLPQSCPETPKLGSPTEEEVAKLTNQVARRLNVSSIGANPTPSSTEMLEILKTGEALLRQRSTSTGTTEFKSPEGKKILVKEQEKLSISKSDTSSSISPDQCTTVGVLKSTKLLRHLAAFYFIEKLKELGFDLHVPEATLAKTQCEFQEEKFSLVQHFEEGCIDLADFLKETKTPECKITTEAIQELALLHFILVNGDGNSRNILVRPETPGSLEEMQTPRAKLFSVDLEAICSHEGEAGIFFTLFNDEKLKDPLSKDLKEKILNISPSSFEEALSIAFESEYAKQIDQEHLELTGTSLYHSMLQIHRIALTLMQEGIKGGLSLRDLFILTTKAKVLRLSFHESLDSTTLSFPYSKVKIGNEELSSSAFGSTDHENALEFISKCIDEKTSDEEIRNECQLTIQNYIKAKNHLSKDYTNTKVIEILAREETFLHLEQALSDKTSSIIPTTRPKPSGDDRLKDFLKKRRMLPHEISDMAKLFGASEEAEKEAKRQQLLRK